MKQRHIGKELTEGVKKSGAEAINSDEEPNTVLDEAQQEKFIEQMQLITTQYVQTWRSMFAWLSLFVIYIHAFTLLGLVPFTRTVITSWTPRSVTVQFLLSPVTLGSAFFPAPIVPILAELVTLFWIVLLYRRCMGSGQELGSLSRFRTLNRFAVLVVAGGWPFLASRYTDNWAWSKYVIIPVSCCLLSIAADTFISGRELTSKGLEKLAAFKYSHRKV